MNREIDIESEKSPEDIEREIDAQRESIGNIVDALESKFTPGQMFDQAMGMMQNNGTTFLTNLGTSVRNNPVPAVVTSVGLLWLMMSQNRPPAERHVYRTGPDQDKMGQWADGLSDGVDSARDRMHQTADSLKGGYQSVKSKASHLADNLSSATDSLSHTAHDVSDRISHTAHDVSDRVARSTQQMGNQFNQLLRDQPLVVAAAGIALGALLGAALPSTRTEQRYMGKTSADIADKVKQQAREGMEAVRDTVTKTTDHSDTKENSDANTTANSANASSNAQSSTQTPKPGGTAADLSGGLGTP
ncbi:MAG: DUF3618 domain-containing protein [Pseudomonadota bacterium]|nr:DUF3618 domain-containing protein [Pseudomonadota bacterium]